MTDDQIRMNRLSLRFADARLETTFAGEQAQKSLRPIQVAIIVVAVMLVAAVSLAVFVFPNTYGSNPRLWTVGVALTACAVAYAVTRSRFFIDWNQWVLFAIVCAISAGTIRFTYDASHEILGTRGYVPMLMQIFVIYSLFRLRLPKAIAAGVLSICAYLGFFVGTGLLSGLDAARHAAILLFANLWGMAICYQMELATRREFIAMRALREEREHSERLLLNILPENVIQELAGTGKVKPARHENASILFTDFASFTQATSTMPADRMVAELNEIFAAFDDIVRAGGIEKIKTIGDAYMAAAGLSDNAPNHAELCARAALRMIAFMEERNRTAAFKWQLRVGIHSGPVVSGVVGKHKYAYDIWGDAVNIASRMESSGESGRVNVSAYTYDLIRSMFACTYRGKISAKGKGEIDMYFVDTANTTAVG